MILGNTNLATESKMSGYTGMGEGEGHKGNQKIWFTSANVY